MQSSVVVLVLVKDGAWVVFKEQLNNVEMPTAGRQMERSLLVLVFVVNVSAVLEEDTDGLEVAPGAGLVQRRVVVLRMCKRRHWGPAPGHSC